MTELQLKEIDESPDSNVLPTTLLNGSRKERQQYLKSIATKVVNRYILDAENVTALLNKVQMSENKEKDRSVARDGETYRYDGKRKRDHEASHGLPTSEPAIIHEVKIKPKRDDMFNYQSSFLEIGLLVKNFYDAISEGDGLRVLRCWKFMLLYLKEDGASSRKYALEALYLQCQVNPLLTHRAAHRLVWNRFLKTKYGTGGNIPLDLALEHFNKLVKALIRNLGSKGLHKNAIDRHCKALAINKQLLDNFDEMCSIRKRSGNHAQKSCRNDLIKVFKGLIDNDAFIFTNGRTYKHFSGITSSLLTNFDVSAMFRWINEHKKMYF